jgi:hypothetical protein
LHQDQPIAELLHPRFHPRHDAYHPGKNSLR